MILETATQKRLKNELDKLQNGFNYSSRDEMIKDYKKIRGQVKKNINQLLKAERGELKGRYESLNGETSPALKALRDKNIDLIISPEIMTDNSIKSQLRAFSKFLIADTSTLKNFLKYRKDLMKRLEKITGVKEIDAKEFFKIWDRIKELKMNVKAEALFNLGSEEIMEYIANKMKDGYTSDEIIGLFQSHLKDLEEQQMKMEEEGLNDPFEL